MTKRVCNEYVFIIGALLGTALSGCGGGTDVPLTDGGGVDVDTGTSVDGGVPSRWPVPSDFPADGPMQPGEGDACQLSVQCAEDRQICVDDACVREERVTSAGLVFGDWRVLTPAEVRATTALPIEVVGIPPLRTVLDENGEVAVMGYGGVTGGAIAMFKIGARTRVVQPAPGPLIDDTILPFGDGFLSEYDFVVSFFGPSGTVEWTADINAATRPPFTGALARVQTLVHTPDGPVVVESLNSDGLGAYDVVEIQRLDVASRHFVPLNFADGPYLSERFFEGAAMGPSGLELIVGVGTSDEQVGRHVVHAVATGFERPIGMGPMPWEVDVRPFSGNSWVAVALRDSLTDPCSSLAFASGAEEPVGRIQLANPGACGGVSSPYTALFSTSMQFSPAPAPGLWIASDDTGLAEATADGAPVRAIRSGLLDQMTVAARFRKTLEVFTAAVDADLDPGLIVAERSLRRRGGV